MLGSAAAIVAGLAVGTAAHAQESSPGLQLEMQPFAQSHELKPLAFDASSLDGLSRQLIESHWSNNYGGSVRAHWEREFRRVAAGLGGGSGWVILGYNRHFGTLENYWLADHMHGPATTEPLLVIDMYEHSYHMDYGAATAQYIDAFFNNVNWETVLSRVEAIA